MPLAFLGILAIVALIISMVFIGAVSRTNPARAQRLTRFVLGTGACVVGAVMSLKGLAVLGAPIAGLGLVMLGLGARSTQSQDQASSDNRIPTNDRAMNRRDALDTLGLNDGASDEEIRAAYKRLIKKVHPDTGGSDALARRIQQAKDVLIGER